MTKDEQSIEAVLAQLMKKNDITVSELARQTRLPQQTIHRLVSGITTNPNYASLSQIADFFRISIDMLTGRVPLETQHTATTEKTQTVPLITWEQAITWPLAPGAPKLTGQENAISINLPISDNGFALEMQDDSMDPYFPPGSHLVFDPNLTVRNNDFALVHRQTQNEIILRQVMVTDTMTLLRPFSLDINRYQPFPKLDTDRYIAVLIQAQKDFI